MVPRTFVLIRSEEAEEGAPLKGAAPLKVEDCTSRPSPSVRPNPRLSSIKRRLSRKGHDTKSSRRQKRRGREGGHLRQIITKNKRRRGRTRWMGGRTKHLFWGFQL